MKRLKWNDVIDAVGLAAVLIGLFLVYKEVRVVETIARAQLSADVNNTLFELDRLALGPDLAPVFLKANEAPETLTAVERWQLNQFLAQVLDQYARECFYGAAVGLRTVQRARRADSLDTLHAQALGIHCRLRQIHREAHAIIDDELAATPTDDLALRMDAAILDILKPDQESR